MIRTNGTVHPGQGGCWFCLYDEGEMLYDLEFDTYVHKECLRDQLNKYPNDPEATIMTHLLQGEEHD